MYIVADVGGTKTALAVASISNGKVSLSTIRRFRNDEYSSFESVLGAFCNSASVDQIEGLGIAVAGRVVDNTCEMTNLDWTIDGSEVSRQFDVQTVFLYNDLAASGYGLEVIADDSLEIIHPGQENSRANRILISPGTGLGESIIQMIDERRIPIPTEGGHADFAPFDGVTSRLWTFVKRRQSRVSVEDILSGPGINNIYRFVVSENGETVDPEMEKKISASPGEIIANRAVEDDDPVCIRAVMLFFDVLAAECGNMALKALSAGGVYIGGGIVPYLLPLLDRPRFVRIFADKGPHEKMLSRIPISVVTATELPLYGAAYHLLKIARA